MLISYYFAAPEKFRSLTGLEHSYVNVPADYALGQIQWQHNVGDKKKFESQANVYTLGTVLHPFNMNNVPKELQSWLTELKVTTTDTVLTALEKIVAKTGGLNPHLT